MNKQLPYLMVLMFVFAVNGYLIGLAFAEEPNIALDQYIDRKLMEVDKGDQVELTITEANRINWDNAMELMDQAVLDGKMLKANCNSIGFCVYNWVTPPDLIFNVTNADGFVRQVSVFCGEGTFPNYTALECQLTEEEKAKQRQIKTAIVLTVIVIIIIISIFAYPKLIKSNWYLNKKYSGRDGGKS